MLQRSHFAERLKAYLRDSRQHPEVLAAKLDVPSPMLRRYLVTDEEPPAYLLARLSKVTGTSWDSSSAAEKLFTPTKTAATAVLSDNPFVNNMNDNNTSAEESRTIDALFPAVTQTEDRSEPVTVVREGRPADWEEHLREHIWIGIRLCGSATSFASAVGVSCPSATRWVRGWTVCPTYYSSIARVVGVSENALFISPTAELMDRVDAAPAMRRTMPEMEEALAKLRASPTADTGAADVKSEIHPRPVSKAAAAAEETPSARPILTVDKPAFFRTDHRQDIEEPSYDDSPIPPTVSHVSSIGGVITAAREEPAFSEDDDEEEDEIQPANVYGGEKREPGDEPMFDSKSSGFSGDDRNAPESFVPGPDDCSSKLAERIQAFMADNGLTLGSLATLLGRYGRPIKIMRLRFIVLGITIPNFAEIRQFKKVLGVSGDRIAVEAQLPSKNIMKSKIFEEVCAECGLVKADGQSGGKPDTDFDEEEAHPSAANVSEVRAVLAPVHSARRVCSESTEGAGRGITALEFGAGTLDFAMQNGSAFLHTVETAEFRPVFEPGTTLAVSTAGFDPNKALFPGDLPANGWYLLTVGGRRLLRRVKATPSAFAVDEGSPDSAFALDKLHVVGRVSATVRVELF